MDAFDSDTLIYAATPAHPLGPRIRRLLAAEHGIGSVLLLPELLSKPLRTDEAEVQRIGELLSRIDLIPVDTDIATQAVEFGAAYRLRAADAVHLATAVLGGADRFITNNRRDFSRSISEIDVAYPKDLPPA